MNLNLDNFSNRKRAIINTMGEKNKEIERIKELPKTVDWDATGDFFEYASTWNGNVVNWKLWFYDEDNDSPIKFESTGALHYHDPGPMDPYWITIKEKDTDVELILKITHTIMLEQYKDLFAKCGFKLVDQKNDRIIKEGLVTDFSMISIRSGTGLWLCGRGSDLFGTLSIL